MESYLDNLRKDFSTQSQLDDIRNEVSLLKKGPSDKTHNRPTTRTHTKQTSPTRVYRSISANDTVHHRRPRAGRHKPQKSTSELDIVDEGRNKPGGREDMRFKMMEHDEEIWKQQQEIDRLERELERYGERKPKEEPRMRRHIDILEDEEAWYEDEISDRLRRLERMERNQRRDEEAREAERQWKTKKWEQAALEAAEKEEIQRKTREEKLKELERFQEEKEKREKIKEEIRDEEARRVFEEQKRREREAAIRYAAVEDYKMLEKQRRADEEQQRKQIEREVRSQIELELGQSLEQVKKIIYKTQSKKVGGDEENLQILRGLSRDNHGPSIPVDDD